MARARTVVHTHAHAEHKKNVAPKNRLGEPGKQVAKEAVASIGGGVEGAGRTEDIADGRVSAVSHAIFFSPLTPVTCNNAAAA